MRLTDDYQYESEEEEEQQQQTSKTLDKKEPLKKLMKDYLKEFNELINREETNINSELFQKHFKFQRLSDTLKAVYTTNDKNKNNRLVNVIKSGLSDLKNEIEKMGEEEQETEKLNKIVDSVEMILEFNKQKQEGQRLKILPLDQMLN